LEERGDDALAKFLIVQQLFPEEEVTSALETVKLLNKDLSGQALAASLLENARPAFRAVRSGQPHDHGGVLQSV